jgi:hypothetical protein
MNYHPFGDFKISIKDNKYHISIRFPLVQIFPHGRSNKASEVKKMTRISCIRQLPAAARRQAERYE